MSGAVHHGRRRILTGMAALAGIGGALRPASLAAALLPTPAQTTGPFYPLTLPLDSDNDLVRVAGHVKAAGGIVTHVGGRVLDRTGQPLRSARVEIWQCDAAGNYSQYGSQTAQTYLRGIQTTNANGEVTFTTIYPGWYQGRATHIHVEVTVGGVSRKVTQMAFPESINNTVYATGVYASRGSNPMSNLSDGIFADSLSSELVTPVGSPTGGYSASCQVAISV